jgi:hypothetical protein
MFDFLTVILYHNPLWISIGFNKKIGHFDDLFGELLVMMPIRRALTV